MWTMRRYTARNCQQPRYMPLAAIDTGIDARKDEKDEDEEDDDDDNEDEEDEEDEEGGRRRGGRGKGGRGRQRRRGRGRGGRGGGKEEEEEDNEDEDEDKKIDAHLRPTRSIAISRARQRCAWVSRTCSRRTATSLAMTANPEAV